MNSSRNLSKNFFKNLLWISFKTAPLISLEFPPGVLADNLLLRIPKIPSKNLPWIYMEILHKILYENQFFFSFRSLFRAFFFWNFHKGFSKKINDPLLKIFHEWLQKSFQELFGEFLLFLAFLII